MAHLLEIHAREKLGFGDNWQVFRWEVKDSPNGDYFQLTGAVTPIEGKKGKPNWEKRDRSTEHTVQITHKEHQAWVKEWEQRTGKCSTCLGEGKVVTRVSVSEGVTYKPCPKCGEDKVEEQMTLLEVK